MSDMISREAAIEALMEAGLAFGYGKAVDIIRALPAVEAGVRELEWDHDGRRLCMDDTMQFSMGYNWDGYECFRREGYGLGCGYIIWPDSICSAEWNLYGTLDGTFLSGIKGEEAAKAAAQADYAARISSALTATPAQDVAGLVRRRAAQTLWDMLHMKNGAHEGMTSDEVMALWDSVRDEDGFSAVTTFLARMKEATK